MGRRVCRSDREVLVIVARLFATDPDTVTPICKTHVSRVGWIKPGNGRRLRIP